MALLRLFDHLECLDCRVHLNLEAQTCPVCELRAQAHEHAPSTAQRIAEERERASYRPTEVAKAEDPAIPEPYVPSRDDDLIRERERVTRE